MTHESVLLKEIIDGLSLEDGDIYLDATVGSGGHMEEVWRKKKDRVVLAGIDADEMSVTITREKLGLSGAKVKLSVLNFRNIDKAPDILDIKNPTKILFDLGWSSDQFSEGERGFSFQKDEPLLMTFKNDLKEDDTTAYDVVNKWSEENLAAVLYGYGEERYSRRIAKAITEKRMEKPIETSKELAEIVKNSVPIFYRFGRIHPATRSFQAIRIAVNDELHALEEGIQKGFQILEKGGRIAVISFHSLEDRIVKNFFKSQALENKGELINKKPITPSDEEINKNPRSRSAKLRIIKKI
ncbi:MAG: 16S rRNA (cytosine(1402)-N(4))-methyltransferase [Candidatus Zambryskibacteria bacterium RIFCSPHIGHO2_12_FULL_38_34]|uniref:Ribosomal RNA small subunit methyltransferase H n=1 Tax=Candidatus Zambryskibacteria bacterium RIFCSPLOWO2_12_FULL_39_16 TaxID=1802775 RepID=A0A1G2UST3_9BACT|nr:MAG: 16S rRNA (cytosine(1402)-N(4))-methyltransferase [Candidatus Zambryskibacteria bacterium RIFCSPHIGHO2_02_FULL_38_22]OHA98141.1 MAG: 16S rRNA (cytosine(1402)-N(4))-methyltransferase [Candidatus Zambryskibacteria bacterium RIFCSPHIGHO2_12_FULL_38_34]OHB07843.1 MAG: 16S rRNA (cytosine(1402)-N(4))-methyltransferase [Candidatus Zambryskibacteria bacterium RIFCSPLOWO2_02_FULL_38_13]OHB12457.1 MAG: 16S rRNA (cytosine(1402)-N(4))-methyltransferase [Candidatus Zambryskibacteria bacterium RIFCSPLO